MKKHYIGIIAIGLSLSAPAKESQSTYREIGVASYYDDAFDGCVTANGETFAQNQMTCAHLWLPLGTMVRVTNLKNHKSIILRINDRGPYIDGRMIDLSRAAAQTLGFIEEGLTLVKLETISNQTYLALCSEDFDAGKRLGYSRNSHLPIENVAVTNNRLFIPDTVLANGINGFRLRKIAPEGRRIERRNKHSYLVFIGIFYRPEKSSAFHEEREKVTPESEPLQASGPHYAHTWMAP